MNKKFLSAVLFGVLMASSTGTFVSCKDYDDDIDAINKELTDIKSQLATLQTAVDNGSSCFPVGYLSGRIWSNSWGRSTWRRRIERFASTLLAI